MKKYIYMLVTRDKYELPLLVCDSSTELAKKMNITKDGILSALYHSRKRGTKCQYVQVVVDDEEELWN